MKPAGEALYRGFPVALQFHLNSGLLAVSAQLPFSLGESPQPLNCWLITSLSLFRPSITYCSGCELTARADDHEKEHGDKNDFWEEVHEASTKFTLLLIFIHIGGVIVTSLMHKENLVKAMIHANKHIPPVNDDKPVK